MRLRPEDEVELLRADRAKLQARVKELEDNLAAATAREAVLGEALEAEQRFADEVVLANDHDDVWAGGYVCGTDRLLELRERAHQARRAALASPSDAAKALLERLVTLESMVGAWTAQKAAAVKEATDLKVAHEALVAVHEQTLAVKREALADLAAARAQLETTTQQWRDADRLRAEAAERAQTVENERNKARILLGEVVFHIQAIMASIKPTSVHMDGSKTGWGVVDRKAFDDAVNTANEWLQRANGRERHDH